MGFLDASRWWLPQRLKKDDNSVLAWPRRRPAIASMRRS